MRKAVAVMALLVFSACRDPIPPVAFLGPYDLVNFSGRPVPSGTIAEGVLTLAADSTFSETIEHPDATQVTRSGRYTITGTRLMLAYDGGQKVRGAWSAQALGFTLDGESYTYHYRRR